MVSEVVVLQSGKTVAVRNNKEEWEVLKLNGSEWNLNVVVR